MLKSVWRPAVSIAGLAVIAGFAFGSAAQAESIQKQCSEKYQAAKAANSLNGETWNQFYKQCAADLKGGGAATTTSAPPPATTSAPPPAATTSAPPPAATTEAAPSKKKHWWHHENEATTPAPRRQSRRAISCSPTPSRRNTRISRPAGRGSRLATTNIAPTSPVAPTAALNGSRRAAAITASATST